MMSSTLGAQGDYAVIYLVKDKIQSFLFIIFRFFGKYFLMGPQDGSDMMVRW
jgi:hypothetical protein